MYRILFIHPSFDRLWVVLPIMNNTAMNVSIFNYMRNWKWIPSAGNSESYSISETGMCSLTHDGRNTVITSQVTP